MLYFDEAGNSGDNLLDPDQPSYLLLSHDYTEEEARQILDPLLKINHAEELHFKNIRKYAAKRRALIDCLNHELIKEGRAFYYVAAKEYAVTAHIVDRLIEPVLHGQGIDIYEGGYNIATTNVMYILGTNSWDKALYLQMCARFVKWVRSRTEEDCTAFYDSVFDLYKTLSDNQAPELLGAVLSSKHLLDIITPSFEKYVLDITVSCFVAHCSYWADLYQKPFDITFDTSKQIAYWRGMIDFLTHEMPEAEVGFGSRKHKYPLLINSLATADSKSIIQLQLADLLASSINTIFIKRIRKSEDDFADEIIQTRIRDLIGKDLWPSTKITPEELNMTDQSGQNALDFIANAARNNPEAYAKVHDTKK